MLAVWSSKSHLQSTGTRSSPGSQQAPSQLCVVPKANQTATMCFFFCSQRKFRELTYKENKPDPYKLDFARLNSSIVYATMDLKTKKLGRSGLVGRQASKCRCSGLAEASKFKFRSSLLAGPTFWVVVVLVGVVEVAAIFSPGQSSGRGPRMP